MINHGKHNVLGIRIDAVDYEATARRILRAAEASQSLAVSALAVHGTMVGVLDATHRYRLNRFDLLVPDGQPLRWALRWLHGIRLADRVYGPQLMLNVCQQAARRQLPVFLFGGTEEMLKALRRNLCRMFPGLQIAGSRASLFRRLEPSERELLIKEILDSGAAIVFVGIGCPRQEVWAFEFAHVLSRPIVAVGAAFPFHAGLLPQAPHAMQTKGLEWCYRLWHEPQRLWKRYLLFNPLYLLLLFLQWANLRHFDPNQVSEPVGELHYG